MSFTTSKAKSTTSKRSSSLWTKFKSWIQSEHPGFEWALLGGVLLRVLLLIVSFSNQGYWSGDTKIYSDMGRHILQSSLSWSETYYPSGYPAFLSVFLAFTNNLWVVSLVQVLLFSLFAYWFCATLNKIVGQHWALLAALFLALDPLWLTYTNIITPDVLGASVFGVVILNLWEEHKRPQGFSHAKILLMGLLLGLASFLKPVYLFVPFVMLPLFWQSRSNTESTPKKNRKRYHNAILAVLFLLAWAIPVLGFVGYRYIDSGRLSFSGHTQKHFAGYTLGMMYMATGNAKTLDEAFVRMNQDRRTLLRKDPKITEQDMAIDLIQKYPVKFFRVLMMSLYKTVFGHANAEIILFFKGEYIDGPGLWMNFNFHGNLAQQLKDLNWSWFIGIFFQFFERLCLCIMSLLGLVRLYQTKHKGEALALGLTIAYFAATPLVFGAPRYFIPGTLVLLIAATQSGVPFKKIKLKF